MAHGFLTLSMLSAMAYSALPKIEGRARGSTTASTGCVSFVPCGREAGCARTFS